MMQLSTQELLSALPADHPARKLLNPLPARTRRKYRNQPTMVDGMRFDSKRESQHYLKLRRMQEAGQVRWFTRQVPFWLPGGIVYRCDFLVVMADGAVRIIDSKGMRTKEYLLKRKLIQASYPITIEEW